MYRPMQKNKYLKYSFSVKKIADEYKNLELHFDSSEADAVINFKVVVG
jgi:hypothetical protein